MKKAFILISLVFEAGILLGVLIYYGQKLDAHFDSGGLITSAFVVLVLVLWFYQIIKLLISA